MAAVPVAISLLGELDGPVPLPLSGQLLGLLQGLGQALCEGESVPGVDQTGRQQEDQQGGRCPEPLHAHASLPFKILSGQVYRAAAVGHEQKRLPRL